jgi:hypothetical protein
MGLGQIIAPMSVAFTLPRHDLQVVNLGPVDIRMADFGDMPFQNVSHTWPHKQFPRHPLLGTPIGAQCEAIRKPS